MGFAELDAFNELTDGSRLVTGGFVWCNKIERHGPGKGTMGKAAVVGISDDRNMSKSENNAG